jgi:2-polyprenyl-6-methoxyphenol hydroxylase-like FAD-dependent oxidoreductase
MPSLRDVWRGAIGRTPMTEEHLDVLIVGAGPTGMVLALELALRGIRVRIVDRAGGPGTASRAMVVHASTLELYRRLGIAEEVLSHGIKVRRAHVRDGGTETACIEVSDFGRGLSPYPFVLSFPQDEHERLLERRLAQAGVTIEWGTSLVGFADHGDRVRATLKRNGNDDGGQASGPDAAPPQHVEAAWLCGCDGAHSSVREGAGIGFPGGTYEQTFYVADVEATGVATDGDLNLCLGTNLLCVVFPIRTTGRFRLIGIVPDELRTSRGNDVTLADVRPFVEELIGIRVGEERWFSTYQVHHRVADHFRKGRIFLAGDAGHVHSPAGGQGMNTGIGDAINLAWKLAAVVRRRAGETILETYEPERIAFARTLVATTDRAFTGAINRHAGGRFVRSVLLPYIVPRLSRFRAFRRLAFRTLSQIRIHYRDSALSDGRAGDTGGKIRGGDRLPWVESSDNFSPLQTLDWQMHVYGAADPAFVAFADRIGIRAHAFPWSSDAERAGLSEGALYLIRPDAYVALACGQNDHSRVEAFLDRFRIRAEERRPAA